MAKPENTEPTYDFPAGLAQPAIRALLAAGYTRLEQLTAARAADLRKLHGMGPKGMDTLQSALAARGLSFADAGDLAPHGAPLGEPILDSPTGWVRDHIKAYVESDGKNGHLWRGIPTLLLTTRGRKSGKLRRTALIYGRDGQNYMIVASKGGAPQHPFWYLNLVAQPVVEIQVGAQKFTARARTASPAEKPRLWKIMSKIFPQYDRYQSIAGREIPLVILEPLKDQKH